MNPYPYITWFINFTMWISFATWINTATFAMYVALLIEPTNTGMHSIQIWCTLTVQKITIYNMNHHYCRNQRLRSSEQPLINLLCAAHNWVLLLCVRTAHNKVNYIACLVQYVDAHSKTKRFTECNRFLLKSFLKVFFKLVVVAGVASCNGRVRPKSLFHLR